MELSSGNCEASEGSMHCQELLAEAKEVDQLPEDADPEKLARVLVAAFFGAQHISWALNDRADLIARVQEDGTCWLAGSTFRERVVMRVSPGA